MGVSVRETLLGEEQAVCILLECFLVYTYFYLTQRLKCITCTLDFKITLQMFSTILLNLKLKC